MYFITICSAHFLPLFGKINSETNSLALTSIGRVVEHNIQVLESKWIGVNVDHYCVMPNHIHLLIALSAGNEKQPSLSTIVGLFKMGVTREVRKTRPGLKVWQRSFYDHICRDEEDYSRHWNYIENNALNWIEDKYHQA